MAQQASLTKKMTDKVLKAFIGAVHKALKDEGESRMDRLRTFVPTRRKARTGVNPRTGAKMTIPAKTVPSF